MGTMTEAVKPGPAAGVQRVAVIGGGTMGNGIAQVFATAGIDVALIDVKQDFVERAMATVFKNLDRVAKKQGWAADKATAILARIRGGTEVAAARDCQVAIEAVSEDFALKKRIFEALTTE